MVSLPRIGLHLRGHRRDHIAPWTCCDAVLSAHGSLHRIRMLLGVLGLLLEVFEALRGARLLLARGTPYCESRSPIAVTWCSRGGRLWYSMLHLGAHPGIDEVV